MEENTLKCHTEFSFLSRKGGVLDAKGAKRESVTFFSVIFMLNSLLLIADFNSLMTTFLQTLRTFFKREKSNEIIIPDFIIFLMSNWSFEEKFRNLGNK